MRRIGLTAVLLLCACQPQARRLLVLDLALSEPTLLNGTVQPWRDEGYNIEYRRFYPHLARADLDRYRVLLFLLGREPEAPSDALTVGDLALLTEWVLRGGVAVLGYDADGEGYLDRWTTNRWLDFLGTGISIGDRLLEDTTTRALTTTGRPQPWAEARTVGDEPLGSPLGEVYEPFPLDRNNVITVRDHSALLAVTSLHAFVRAPRPPRAPSPRGVGARPPRGARRARRAAAGTGSGGARPPAACAARRCGHDRTAARPRSQARPRDQRSRMAAAAGDARPLGAAPAVAGRAPRCAARSLARFTRHAARCRRVQSARRRCRPGGSGLGARALGGAGRRAARLGGRGGPARADERRVDSGARLRSRAPQSRRFVARGTRRGTRRTVRARFGIVGRGTLRRVRRPRSPGRGAAYSGHRPRLGHRGPTRLLDGPGVLRRRVAPRDRRLRQSGGARLAAVGDPLRGAAGRRAAVALLPRPGRRGRRAGRSLARPDPEAAARPLFRVPPAPGAGRLVCAGTAARVRPPRPAAAPVHAGAAHAPAAGAVPQRWLERRARRGRAAGRPGRPRLDQPEAPGIRGERRLLARPGRGTRAWEARVARQLGPPAAAAGALALPRP